MNITNGNLLNEYRQAVENEISTDESLYLVAGKAPKNYGFLPRPTKWISQTKRTPGQINTFAYLLKVLWLAGGSTLYFFKEGLLALVPLFTHSNRIEESYLQTEFALAFSTRATELINRNTMGKDPLAWIFLPWVPHKLIPDSVTQFDIFSFLTFSDLARTFYLSVASVYSIRRHPQTAPWTLQSYTAFRWFLTRIALSKIKGGHFVTTEHFDRWAVLIDQVVRYDAQASLTIVQHGSVSGLSASELFPIKLKYRLRSVQKLFAYDEGSALAFKNHILDAAFCRPEVHYFTPQIVLSDEKIQGSYVILFVGHPVCEDFHLRLWNELSAKENIFAYYKPHPTTPCGPAIEAASWKIIRDKTFYPKVHLLVSYPSTLVNEYANSGIDSVVHAMNVATDHLTSIQSEVLVKLREHRISPST